MNIKRHIKSKVGPIALLLGIGLSAPAAHAGGGLLLSDLFSKNKDIDHKSFYVGGALGATQLEPRVLVSGGTVTDDISTGYKVYAGYNFNDAWSAELFYADLGHAEIDVVTDESDVDYQAYGIGLTYGHRINNRFKLIGKLGVSALENQVKEGLAYRQVNSTTVYKGLGLEYQINKKLSLRVDYDHYDKDYQMLSMGLKFSF